MIPPSHSEVRQPNSARAICSAIRAGSPSCSRPRCWERFSYFGNAALVVLYMVKYLLEPGRVETVLGFGAVKAALEFLFGRLDPQPLASQIFGFYTGLGVFHADTRRPLADRLLGQRRTVIIGGVLMAIGHFMMAFEALFLVALLLLILGIGAFKPNISTQVGSLYAPGDIGATAPIRSSISASISGRFWRRWSAARSPSNSAGTTALPPPGSGCWWASASTLAASARAAGRVAARRGSAARARETARPPASGAPCSR